MNSFWQKNKSKTHWAFDLFVALPARFERATFRLGGGCSILLSYGSIKISLFIVTQLSVYVNIMRGREIYVKAY